MTLLQFLLTKAGEECAEIAQRASKANLFGIHEVQPGQAHDNAERLLDEVMDLQVVLDLLREHGDLPPGPFDPKELAAKRAKVLRFMAYSVQCGILRVEPSEAPAGFQAP